MDKRKRELAKAIKPYNYRLVGHTGSSHVIIQHRHTGHRLVTSWSPTNFEHMIKRVIRDIRRYGS